MPEISYIPNSVRGRFTKETRQTAFRESSLQIDIDGYTAEFNVLEPQGGDGSEPLVFCMPGLGDKGIGIFQGIAGEMEERVGGIGFSYTDVFDIEKQTIAIWEAIKQYGVGRERDMVLQATSYGSLMLHRLLVTHTADELSSLGVRGALFTAPLLGRNTFSQRAQRVADYAPSKLLAALGSSKQLHAKITKDSAPYTHEGSIATRSSMLDQVPAQSLVGTIDFPIVLCQYDGEQLLDNTEAQRVLFAQTNGAIDVVTLPSGKGHRGHRPADWHALYKVEAEACSLLLGNDEG